MDMLDEYTQNHWLSFFIQWSFFWHWTHSQGGVHLHINPTSAWPSNREGLCPPTLAKSYVGINCLDPNRCLPLHQSPVRTLWCTSGSPQEMDSGLPKHLENRKRWLFYLTSGKEAHLWQLSCLLQPERWGFVWRARVLRSQTPCILTFVCSLQLLKPSRSIRKTPPCSIALLNTSTKSSH
jgi:hypothetical protein